MILLFSPFIFQTIAMCFDELYFHKKRGLPLWEKIGHPLDTLTVLIAYLFLSFNEPSLFNLKVYIFLSAFSCLFVTKDEFVHTKYCEAKENWLHAVLFILHPLTFLSAGFIWFYQLSPFFLKIQPFVILFVLSYQILYWSFFGKNK
jgi:hypothetical protein